MRTSPILALVLVACGGAPAPAPQAVIVPLPVATTPAPTVDAESCVDRTTCAAIGFAALRKGDDAVARVALAKACPGDVDACAALASLLMKSAEQVRVADAAHIGCALGGVTDENREMRAAACVAWSDALRYGNGVAKSESEALAASELACKLGASRGCDRVNDAHDEQTFAAEVAANLPGTPNQQFSSMIDGHVSRTSCRSDAPADGFDTLPTPLAGNSPTLETCGDPSGYLHVLYTVTPAKKVANLKILAGPASAKDCIERAIKNAKFAGPARTCVASFKPVAQSP